MNSQGTNIIPPCGELNFCRSGDLHTHPGQGNSEQISKSDGSFTLSVYYVVPSDMAYRQAVLQRIMEATHDIQAWYQVATGGLTWNFTFAEVVRVYKAIHTREFYRDNGDWWGSLLGEMTQAGLPLWKYGTVTAIWAHGAGWWAGGAASCGGACGVALLGVEIFPEFNNPVYSGRGCPSGVGVQGWPCTPVGAYAHELGHTLGLRHPAEDPWTAAVAPHSIMQTHWNYPDFAPGAERPWGFLRNERSILRKSLFLYSNVDLTQVHQNEDIMVNLPQDGSPPVADFEARVSEDKVVFVNKTQGTDLIYWTFGDQTVSNQMNPIHSYSKEGIYTVALRASNIKSMMGVKTLSIRIGSTSSRAEDVNEKPDHYRLGQNYPNPFNPSTTIKYEVPKSSEVRLIVFDIFGREVSVLVNEKKESGYHEIKFDGSGLASGVYYYRLQAGTYVQTRKLLLLR